MQRVAGPSWRRPGFNPRTIHVEYVVDRLALGQLFLRISPVLSSQYHSTDVPFSLVNLSRMLYNLNNIELLNKTLIFYCVGLQYTFPIHLRFVMKYVI